MYRAGKATQRGIRRASPYVMAGIRTLANNPDLAGQVAGVGAGTMATAGLLGLTGAEVAAAPATGGATATAVPVSYTGALTTGLGTLALAKKTVGDIKSSYKKELQAGKKKKSLKMHIGDIQKAHDVAKQTRTIYRSKRVPPENMNY